MDIQRFYIDTHGNDDEAYREAMQFACQLANKSKDIKRIVLLIHSKQNTGWFERLFGSTVVKQLFAGTKFKDCNAIVKFETVRTYKDGYGQSDIVITCGLDSEDVLKIDDMYSVKAIIAVPWLKDKIEKWVKTWSPKELRGNKSIGNAFPEPSCIVKKALESLTSSINLSTGISHPMDEDKAKTTILALHKYEPSLNPDIIGAYLIRELNWDTEHAKDIETLIGKLNNGRHFQGGERTGLQTYYKRWKEECEKNED
jgi:hypothetical protein